MHRSNKATRHAWVLGLFLACEVAWYFRKALFNCLGDIFGCAPQKTHAVQSKDLEGGRRAQA